MTTSTPESSPDAVDYLGLTLYDADEQDLVDTAIADATSKLPDWEPREGNQEVVLIESLALIAAEVVYSLNRLAESVIEGIMTLYGLTRDPGAPAVGTVEFTLADTLGHTIPAGTTVRVTVAETGELVDFTTDEPLEILAGASTGTVTVTANDVGIAPNGIPAATALELIDSVPYVDTVVTTTTLSSGREVESDESYFNRGAGVLSRLVTTLVLADHFTQAALEHPFVFRAHTLDLYDPTGEDAPGDNPGHVTVAVLGVDGATLSGDQKDAVKTSLEAKALAGLTVHVIDVATAEVDVTASVTIVPGYDPEAVTDAVAAEVEAYLSPNAFPWVEKVWRNDLISLIDRVPGVDRVASLTTPAADFDLNVGGDDYAALPTAGTITITEAT